jgi:hypothetical protein
MAGGGGGVSGIPQRIIRPVRPRRPYLQNPPTPATSLGPPSSQLRVIQPYVQVGSGQRRAGLILWTPVPKAAVVSASGKALPALVISRYASSRRDGQGLIIHPPLSPPASLPGGNRLAKSLVAPVVRWQIRTPEPIWVRPQFPVPAPQTAYRWPIVMPAAVRYPARYRGAFLSISAPLVALAPPPPVGGSSITCKGITIFEAIQGGASLQEQMTGIVLLED